MPEVFNRLTADIVNAVGDGEKITYTTSGKHNFATGMSVTVVNVNPTSFNVKNVVIDSVPSETTFTVSSDSCCTYVRGGKATARYYNKFSGVKFGLNTKLPTKIVEAQPLYDISTGLKLTDVNQDTLYTEERGPYSGSFSSKTATSVAIGADEKNPLLVEEQFKESTPVSTSLLGVERAETQLGLFSDVSVYGFDRNTWEYYQWIGGPAQPNEWFYRKNPKYGNHYSNVLDEVAEEQALCLKLYPINYTFPYNQRFQENGLYVEALYLSYRNFIKLGNFLFQYYHDTLGGAENKQFALDNFLPATMVQDANEINYGNDPFVVAKNMEQIERWTQAWMSMRDGLIVDPSERKVLFPASDQTGRITYPPAIALIDSTNSIPGYSASAIYYYQQLESKRAYRYQPGRVSGFTFGFRADTDPTTLDNTLEWGCCNDTDEYVFQIRGSQFNIVRRSVIPLPEANLKTMGLTKDDQVIVESANPRKNKLDLQYSGSKEAPVTLYETVISRDKFNQDPLNGNGPSGYIISVPQVTMYKIEFSWYGAIGAKFYAYIPSGNGDCRWVLMHTMVIENQLGAPCLKDPYFKFRYSCKVNNTSNIRYPIKMYKYGASYYIDGGDEGNVSSHSYVSNIINASPSNGRTMIGIAPKDFIVNKDGIETKNKKDIIPLTLSATADDPVRIDVLQCEACPGYGFHYSPSLHANTNGSLSSNFTIDSETGETLFYSGSSTEFETTRHYNKLIGNGVYSSYISVLVQDAEAKIIRRIGNSSPMNNEINENSNYANVSKVKFQNNFVGDIRGVPLTLRLSGYELVAAENPLTKPNISIKYLNPQEKDTNGSFCEFLIGITNKKPSVNPTTGELEFDEDNGHYSGYQWIANNVLFGEYTQYSAVKDTNGYEYSEYDPRIGNVFNREPNLPYPPGVDSGYCSEVNVEVKQTILTCEYRDKKPDQQSVSGNYLVFPSKDINNIESLNGGEFGVKNGPLYDASGVKFSADSATEFIENFQTKYYIPINGPIDAGTTKIAVREIRLFGRYVNKSKIFTFSVFPLYVVVGLRDNSKVNNITIEEYDTIGKFNYTPNWLRTDPSKNVRTTKITVANSGTTDEAGNFLSKDRLNPTTGLYEMSGRAIASLPPANFNSNARLDSALIDYSLQQPLRPASVKTSIFLEGGESKKVDLSYVFGRDRYTVSPGSYNSSAVFFSVKSTTNNTTEAQITITAKEQ